MLRSLASEQRVGKVKLSARQTDTRDETSRASTDLLDKLDSREGLSIDEAKSNERLHDFVRPPNQPVLPKVEEWRRCQSCKIGQRLQDQANQAVPLKTRESLQQVASQSQCDGHRDANDAVRGHSSQQCGGRNCLSRERGQDLRSR